MKNISFYAVKNGIRYPFLYYTGVDEDGHKVKVWMSNPKNRAKFKSREDFRKYCGDYFLINGDIGDGVVISPEDIRAEVNIQYRWGFMIVGMGFGYIIFEWIGLLIFGGLMTIIGECLDWMNNIKAYNWNTRGTHFKK